MRVEIKGQVFEYEFTDDAHGCVRTGGKCFVAVDEIDAYVHA